MSELKGCPVCDGRGVVANTTDVDGCFWAYVECSKCGLRTRGKWASSSANTCPIFYAEVRDEWNTRQAQAQGSEGVVCDHTWPAKRVGDMCRDCRVKAGTDWSIE